jgi:23S rRNA (uridine2552-2'-O)-methyltransferase
MNDVYVRKAREENFRNRAAFKLIQLDDKFSFLRKSSVVLDLGCFSGGWSQVALQRCSEGTVVGVDKLRIEQLPNHYFVQGDINDAKTLTGVENILKDKLVDVVLSDIAPSTTGVSIDDHLAITQLNLQVFNCAQRFLKPNGWLVIKSFYGPETEKFLVSLKSAFKQVIGNKPDASRKESREIFYVCKMFKGRESFGREVASSYRFKREGEERVPADNQKRNPQE